MNRKLLAVLGGVIVIALAVWWFALRGGTAVKQATAPAQPAAKIEPPKPRPRATETAPEGMAPTWVADADPEGTARLEGQVVDDHGDPVGKATVWLSSVPPRTTTTEGDGSFAFDKVVARRYVLSARSGDLVGGPLPYTLGEKSDPAVIRLARGTEIAVRVVDDAAKPIANARVAVLGGLAEPATTGPDGTATIKPAQPGWASVRAQAEGFAPGSTLLLIGSSGTTTTVTLHKGFAVSGRVVDEKGASLAGVEVMPGNVFDIPDVTDPVKTDAKGAFTFAALAPGTHVLTATDHEHAPARSSAITVEDKPISGVTIAMQAGGQLAGTVVDGDGKPVPFATVRVGAEGQQMWQMASRQTVATQTGTFELRGLARTKLKARAESDTAASAIVAVDLTTERAHTGLRLVLDVKGTIGGIVVDESGQPIPEISVNAFPDILGGANGDAMMLAGMSAAMTDGGGRFALRGLPDGAYRLRAAHKAARGRYDWGQDGVPAKTGDKDVRITLAAPGSLTGKLALENGKAPVYAQIQLGSQTSTAAADGTFTLSDLTPGSYDLHVRGPEFAPFIKQDLTIAPSKQTDAGTLTLVRGRRVHGTVVDGSGNLVAGAKVKSGDMLYSMQGADDSQLASIEEMSGIRSTTSDQDGGFSLIGIAKKRTSILADHPTQGRSDAIEIPEGTDDPPPITLTLHGFGQIVGTVTSQGKPVASATITATPKGGGAQVQVAQSEPDGSFTLSKVPEGSVVVSAMQQSMMALKSTSTTVQVTARKQTKVTIDIPVGSITLTVQVKALPGQKVDAAQVFLFHGVIAARNAKAINDAFLGGGVAGMKFWFGEGKPLPEFDQVVPGDYSVCTIPIVGDLNDSKFQQRLQEHLDSLAVYCKQMTVTPTPEKQTFVHEVPSMTPLPN